MNTSAPDSLLERIALLETRINDHVIALASLQFELQNLQSQLPLEPSPYPLSLDEYKRYGRQLIMPEIGIRGQQSLKSSRVLIVGAGGLGCPAAAYLAGAGVGVIGIVDGDSIEVSNLQRQILYGDKIGKNKAISLKQVVSSINPLIKVEAYSSHLVSATALDLISQYDLVLDCTDTPASRYLISDACVISCKVLVSASALKTDGQLMVLNNPPNPKGQSGSPCYRCVFPKPPPATSVQSCSEGGILGPVVGTMGVLQALEAIKVIISWAKLSSSQQHPASMLLFSACSTPPFRTVRLKPTRRLNCMACSADGSITEQSIKQGSTDYIQFCGINIVDPLSLTKRLTAEQFAVEISQAESEDEHPVIIDVRDNTQFGLCNLDGSVNVPWPSLQGKADDLFKQLQSTLSTSSSKKAYIICRLGNDSQTAIQRFENYGFNSENGWNIKDVIGGLKAYKERVDPKFPEY